MKHLRRILGDEWVEQEILGPNPSHPLGLWHRKNPKNPVVLYVDNLIDFILNSGQVRCNPSRLAAKLKAEFAATIVEMGYAYFLAQQGFTMTMEPFAPSAGPDLLAVREKQYFVEIRKVGLNEVAEAFEQATEEVFGRLRDISSGYAVLISMTQDYTAHSTELKQAIGAVERTLERLMERGMQTATLYYYGPDNYTLNEGGKIEPEFDYSDPVRLVQQVQQYEKEKNAPFVARFTDTGKEGEHTVVGTLSLGSHPREAKPDESYLRLRGVLAKKREQLPKGARGILVLDLSDLWMIGPETIERALYGDLRIHFQVGPDGTVDDETNLSRAANGFFLQTSRVSAVVVENMRIGESVEVARFVYPTNNSNARVLSQAELCCFGTLQNDLEHLCSDRIND